MSMRSLGTVLALIVVALGATACADRKEPAEKAMTRIENELNDIRADAQKYAADQLQATEATAARMKADLDKQEYGSVLATLPEINQQLRVLHTTVESGKSEAEAMVAAAQDEWNDLTSSVPPLGEKRQARVD